METQTNGDRPFLILKPDIFNYLIPELLKNTLVVSPIVLLIYFIFVGILKIGIIRETSFGIIYPIVIVISIAAVIPLFIKSFFLQTTTYYFYSTYVVSEFNFLIIKRHSVPYHQITDITLNISIWDRICHSGDIVLLTAEETSPNLILFYVKNPEKIEHCIYSLVYKHRNTSEKK
jgi:hypothetical protein